MVIKRCPALCDARYLWLLGFMGLIACNQAKSSQKATGFEKKPQEYTLTNARLNEVSGIADSKANPGYLWVQQDSGNPPEIALVKKDGTDGKSIRLPHVINRDWEDIVLSSGPKPATNYLYIAETGDNLLVYADYAIYRLEEPLAAADTVQQVDRIAFFYPDGSHNAEAILVDPATKDIYIITKTEIRSKVFRMKYPYSTTHMNRVEEVATLGFNYAVSAALSPGGNEIVVKTYDAIYQYHRSAGETIVQALHKEPVKLPYVQEPQGEAIVFDNSDSGYFTLSEKALASKVKIYFYKRN
ncbi:hypothetical protein [Longitalea luteola]|uniref:hypothetical protein n=1 Tax=Longitalea luteola TaxID=2812563 RepID=UPI001A979893|nr:hypothetical protein [Longitalea luteola]